MPPSVVGLRRWDRSLGLRSVGVGSGENSLTGAVLAGEVGIVGPLRAVVLDDAPASREPRVVGVHRMPAAEASPHSAPCQRHLRPLGFDPLHRLRHRLSAPHGLGGW